MTKTNKKLAILGASGHGFVLAEAAELMNTWDEIVFFDDAYPEIQVNGSISVIGNTDDLLGAGPTSYDVAFGIGNNQVRLKKYREFKEAGFDTPTITHPSATISKYSKIGDSSLITAGATINPRSIIGPACIINTNAIIEHDCIIGEAVHISPNAAIAGTVHIGDKTWIGIGACIRNNITIEKDVVIGAGSVVISNISAGQTAYGNPAKPTS